MRLSTREGWVGAEYDLRSHTSEMLSVLFPMDLDEDDAHEVLEGVEGWVLLALEDCIVQLVSYSEGSL